MSIYELLMLICFGAAWPFSIIRSWESRSTNGKSLLFMLILICGYVMGILNKVVNDYDGVIYLYSLNLAMVTIDSCLWIRNRLIEKGERTGECGSGA